MMLIIALLALGLIPIVVMLWLIGTSAVIEFFDYVNYDYDDLDEEDNDDDC